MIPQKKSSRWLVVFLIYTMVIFISLLSTRLLLGSEIVPRNIWGFVILSTGSALIPSLGGFLGKRIFFLIYTIASIIGILYMFYVVIGNTAPGWEDLTSIIGYLFIVVIGFVLAIVSELIRYVVKPK
jgi:hypothetical protein